MVQFLKRHPGIHGARARHVNRRAAVPHDRAIAELDRAIFGRAVSVHRDISIQPHLSEGNTTGDGNGLHEDRGGAIADGTIIISRPGVPVGRRFKNQCRSCNPRYSVDIFLAIDSFQEHSRSVRAHPGLVGPPAAGAPPGWTRARRSAKSDVFALDDVIIAVHCTPIFSGDPMSVERICRSPGLAGYYSLIRVDENHVLHNLIIAAECDREGISGDARWILVRIPEIDAADRR